MIMKAVSVLAASLVMPVLVAQADAKKFVGFAWEFSRMSITNLVGYVDELDKTPLDGIGVYLNERAPDGSLTSTHNIMRSRWSREALKPLLPLARDLTKHRSMRESFIGTFRAPNKKRIEWTDDSGWGLVASNMAIAAWFAKAGGFRGISMDPEDYHYTAQFVRQGGDAPYDELCRLARRRGREVFEGVFREFSDIRILSFWFLSMEHMYLGSIDPSADMRERGYLWPAFVDGIFDAMPPTALIIDGCEHSYRYESSRGDFHWAANAMKRRLPSMLSPENRGKYRDLTSVSFGLYLDMFTNPKGASWYFGPVDGSRLRHFERNLNQAAEAADEYVWFWGEKFCWADWRGKGPVDNRKINQNTWDSAVPGLEDMILAVKDSDAYAEKRIKELKAEGAFHSMNANMECRSEGGMVPSPYTPWQQKKNRQGRLYGDSSCGDGDSYSLAAEGVENGAYSVGVTEKIIPGDRLLVTMSVKGEGAFAIVAWKRGGVWDWNVLSPVHIRLGAVDSSGWRRAKKVLRVPEGADGAGLILSMRQKPRMKCNFDNVSIVRLDGLKLNPFTVGAEAFDPNGGHIQGIAATKDALYASQMTRLVKLDWTGKVLAMRDTPNHTGDIVFHDGYIYTALAVLPGNKEGRIQVYDRDLNFVREKVIDRAIDGIACADGVLYVGMGAKEQPSANPHRVNVLGRFDAKTLEEIAPRAEFDYGHKTRYGFQDIVYDGRNILAAFYAVDGAPCVAAFDKDLKIKGTSSTVCSQGFDILPPSMRENGRRFVRATTSVGKDPASISCTFDFIELEIK